MNFKCIREGTTQYVCTHVDLCTSDMDPQLQCQPEHGPPLQAARQHTSDIAKGSQTGADSGISWSFAGSEVLCVARPEPPLQELRVNTRRRVASIGWRVVRLSQVTTKSNNQQPIPTSVLFGDLYTCALAPGAQQGMGMRSVALFPIPAFLPQESYCQNSASKTCPCYIKLSWHPANKESRDTL